MSDVARVPEEVAQAEEAEPKLGRVLRRARLHRGLTLRAVEERTGLSNAHLSQIERGVIQRPDLAIVLELAELYGLDSRLVLEWGGYVDAAAPGPSHELVGLALRFFMELDPVTQSEALTYLERLRNERKHRALPHAAG